MAHVIHQIHTPFISVAKVNTLCGMEGWHEGADEYSTVSGGRFEAYHQRINVTCKRCLKLGAPTALSSNHETKDQANG